MSTQDDLAGRAFRAALRGVTLAALEVTGLLTVIGVIGYVVGRTGGGIAGLLVSVSMVLVAAIALGAQRFDSFRGYQTHTKGQAGTQVHHSGVFCHRDSRDPRFEASSSNQ